MIPGLAPLPYFLFLSVGEGGAGILALPNPNPRNISNVGALGGCMGRVKDREGFRGLVEVYT